MCTIIGSRKGKDFGILAPFDRMTKRAFPSGKAFRVSAIISVFEIMSGRRGGGKTQQLAGVVERDGDVGHDGRTCGRTGTYALADYLRSDKAVPLTGDFPVSPFLVGTRSESRSACEK